MKAERTEMHGLAAHRPELGEDLKHAYETRAARCDVMRWEELQKLHEKQRNP